ncbi:MAG: hypothetical protein LAQ30_22295 [Acidobacteriia bacterium]|nr:hypothetical protein [Terriglobia bacterium]
MKRLILAALILYPALGDAQRRVDNWKVNEQETVQRTFNVAPGSKLEVDNVNGYIHVTGAAGAVVQATVQKHVYAESDERLQAAKRDVTLDISQQGNTVRFYVNGPFRNKDGGVNGDRRDGYEVDYDFEIQVPEAIELALKTINGGPIQVKKTNGNFAINGINGGIEMEDVAGSGSANTINGPVKVTFSRNPDRDSQFKTINGAVDVYFPAGLNADVHFKTLNGGVYTDFQTTPLPGSQALGESKNGRFTYHSDRSGSVRIGGGGPKLTFDTLNGPIRLHSKTL